MNNLPARTPDVQYKEDRLPFLDGLRGIAAVWVIVAHSLYLTGSDIKYLNRGDIAVDLFMILSGFLMAYHYYLREGKEPWEKPSTWGKFYLRRFFRIAPLYYTLLLVFFLLGPAIADCRAGLAVHFPDTYTDPIRFLDRGWLNIFTHVTFTYGLFKTYVVRTVMPDWSITLEMQFYLAFPFLMLALRRYYFVFAVPVLYTLSYQMNAVLYHNGYEKPSVLTMSLMYFLIGMLLALFNRFRGERLRAGSALVLAFVLAWLTQERFVLAIVLLITLLLNPRTVGKPVQFISTILSSRFSTWLADMSYSAYLVHMGVMMPVAYLCSQSAAFCNWPGPLRFLTVFVLTVIPTYLLGTILFHFIEKNGIVWGKKLIQSLRS